MKKELAFAAALIVMLTGVSGAQDVQKGENSFKKCLPCHSVGPDARNTEPGLTCPSGVVTGCPPAAVTTRLATPVVGFQVTVSA